MMTKKASGILILLTVLASCSGQLAGTKGKFSEPTQGKALSVTVRRISGGGLATSIMLEVSNPSNKKVALDPLKIKIIDTDGKQTETTYNLKRTKLEEIEFAGGAVIQGNAAVVNPNKSEQPTGSAYLAAGERFVLNLEGAGKDFDKAQVSFGPEGSAEQEVFAISK